MAEITTLSEAVRALVHDGDVVAAEGFTHLIPHAAGHELIRQGRRNLALIRMTPDTIYDQLIGAGCARRLTFSWGGNPGVGSLHRFRDAVEHAWPAPLELDEHSHAGMAAAYAAGAANLPFGVLRGYGGTDLAKRADVAWVDCPFTGERLAAVRAHRPDVGIVHAQRADRRGNVQLWGIAGVQKEVVLASARAIVTVEEIVDEARAAAGRGRPAVVDDRRRRARARRGAPVVRARLLRPRQRLLRRLGGDQPRPGGVHRLDRAPRPRHRRRRRVPPERRGRVSAAGYTADEMMAVAAARRLCDGAVCFVGIGLPSLAANLARATHAPGCVLVYESGTIGAKPNRLPLSIGDGDLAETADAVVSVPEMFSYWLQGGRIDVGFLGAAQVDRHANLNSTVIGEYERPRVRLPGAGGAPEIATSVAEVLVLLRQTPRAFVERLDFLSSLGSRVSAVVTDLGILEPGDDGELELTHVHPGTSAEDARAATAWDLRVAPALSETEPPTEHELTALRELKAR